MTDKPHETSIGSALHEMEATHTEEEVKFHVVTPDVLRKTKKPLYAGRYVAVEQVATADKSKTNNTQEIYVSEEIKNEKAQAIMAKLAKILLETVVDQNTKAYKTAIEQFILSQGNPTLVHGTVEFMLEEIIQQIEAETRATKHYYEAPKEQSKKLIALKIALAYLQNK